MFLLLKMSKKMVSGQMVSPSFEPWVLWFRLRQPLTFLLLCSLYNDVVHTFSIVSIRMKTRSKIIPRVPRELIKMLCQVSQDTEGKYNVTLLNRQYINKWTFKKTNVSFWQSIISSYFHFSWRKGIIIFFIFSLV